MTREKLEALLRQALATEMDLDPDTIRPEDHLKDLDVGSLDAVNLLMTLEETLGIEVDLEDFLELQTVEQLVDFLEQKQLPSS